MRKTKKIFKYVAQHIKKLLIFATKFPWRGIYECLSIVLSYCEMKKLVLFAAVIVAISLSGCKKAAPVEPVVPEEAIEVVEPAGDEVVEVEEAPAEVVAE